MCVFNCVCVCVCCCRQKIEERLRFLSVCACVCVFNADMTSEFNRKCSVYARYDFFQLLPTTYNSSQATAKACYRVFDPLEVSM